MALSGHANGAEQCLLSGAKQTWPKDDVRSAYDPKRVTEGLKVPQCSGLLAHRVCYRLGGNTGGVGSAPPRFRTIQVCAKDLPGHSAAGWGRPKARVSA
jgi:hypothetical protein